MSRDNSLISIRKHVPIVSTRFRTVLHLEPVDLCVQTFVETHEYRLRCSKQRGKLQFQINTDRLAR